MEAMDAIKNAEGSIQEFKDYFLCSCFACIKNAGDEIKEWTLLLFNDKTNMVLDIFVNDKFVTIGEETPPIADIERPDMRSARLTAEQALGIASGKFKGGTINVLLTLHQKSSLVWTINMITPAMTATTFEIDAQTGEIIREETTSLIRKL